MAKGIYKQKGSAYYWIRYAGLDGKIIRESAKTPKFKEAEAILSARKRTIFEGKQPEPVKKIKNYIFNELVTEYKKWAERQRSYKSKAYLIEQLSEVFGNIPLRRFNSMLLEQYQTERLQQNKKPVKNNIVTGNKPATVNRLIATIKHMFTKAVEWDMVEEDTLKRIRKVKFLEENNKRLRYLSKEECQELIKSCEPHLKPIIITALNTGCRKGEILSLKWDNIDLKHGFIRLEHTKNGDKRNIPISDDLKALLQGITRRIDILYVFFDSVTGNPYQDVKRSFNTALRRAKIYDFKFHDLRHTFASHLVMAGVDITTVSRLLGHKSLTMTLRYAHLAPDHLSKAVNMINLTGESKRTAYLLHSQAGNQ